MLGESINGEGVDTKQGKFMSKKGEKLMFP